MGLQEKFIFRVYFYEATVLVFAGSLMGTLVGTGLSFTMTLQYSTFVGMPTVFYFPLGPLFSIFLLSLICALASTYAPVRDLLKHRPISVLLRQ